MKIQNPLSPLLVTSPGCSFRTIFRGATACTMWLVVPTATCGATYKVVARGFTEARNDRTAILGGAYWAANAKG
jgi:hypothetical protein